MAERCLLATKSAPARWHSARWHSACRTGPVRIGADGGPVPSSPRPPPAAPLPHRAATTRTIGSAPEPARPCPAQRRRHRPDRIARQTPATSDRRQSWENSLGRNQQATPRPALHAGNLRATRRWGIHLRRPGLLAGAVRHPRPALPDLQVLPWRDREASRRPRGARRLRRRRIGRQRSADARDGGSGQAGFPTALWPRRGNDAPPGPLHLRAALGPGNRPPLSGAGTVRGQPRRRAASGRCRQRAVPAPRPGSPVGGLGFVIEKQYPIRGTHK